MADPTRYNIAAFSSTLTAPSNRAKNVHAEGHGSVHIGNSYHIDNPTTLGSMQQTIFSKLRTSIYLETKDRIPIKGAGTCQWFLGHPSYYQWQQQQSSSVLLVSADPGCGKSVLTRHLVDQAMEADGADRDALKKRRTCYFFFKEDVQDQRSAACALRCLLHQLLGLDDRLLFTQKIVNIFEQHGDHAFESIGLLWGIIVQVVQDPRAGEVVCFLDALDECNRQDCEILLDYVSRFYQSTDRDRGKLKLFLSGRPYKYIRKPLPLSTNEVAYQIHGHDTTISEAIVLEINTYISVKVESMTGLSSRYKKILINELLQVENRTYLWVGLVFKLLEQQDFLGPAEITAFTSISPLPRTVNEAYELILSRSTNRDDAMRLLQIILAAKKPLTVTEMASALATTDHIKEYDELHVMDEEVLEGYVRELCGFFVTIVDDKVFLLHQTASDFLTRCLAPDSRPVHDLRWQGSINLQACHGLLARICMRYLDLCQAPYSESCKRFGQECANITPSLYAESQWMRLRDAGSPARPSHDERKLYFHRSTILTGDFFHYCATNWYIHARKADTPADDLMLQLCGVQENRLLLSMWSRTLNPLRGPIETISWKETPPLAVSCFCNLENAARKILRSVPVASFCDWSESVWQALAYAAAFNLKKMVVLLLDAVRDETYFNLAFEEEREYTEPFLRQLQKDQPHLDPLSYSVQQGHNDIVQMLLQAGAKPKTKKTNWGPSLIDAVISKSAAKVNTLQLLLDYGADPDSKDNLGRTALHHAANRGDHACIDILVLSGADANEFDKKGVLPIHLAANERCLASVMGLISVTIDGINAQDCALQTPLFHALRSFSSKPLSGFMEKLLNLGANVHIRDCHGEIPLHQAARSGKDEAVSLLVSKACSDPNSVSYQGDTPFTLSIDRGSSEIVSLLLEAATDPDTGERGLGALLHHAAKSYWDGMDVIVDLLLKKGANANARNSSDQTPLHAWALGYSEEAMKVVSHLLCHGADPNSADAAGNTPLHYAAHNSGKYSYHISRLLLDRGASVHAESESGQSPLHHWAASTCEGGEDTIRLLLLKGADPNAVDREKRTPLAYCRNQIIAEILLASGALLLPEDSISGESCGTPCIPKIGSTLLEDSLMDLSSDSEL